jgi:3-hydroxyacyl-CoA dehydrogenase
MEDVGQVPVLVRREIEGFLLNRLQGALLREAWALFEEGYASAEDIDKTVSEGLGLRWSFLGPFETIDLNAPGGVRDYAERFGPLFLSILRSRSDPRPWDAELIGRVEKARRGVLAQTDLAERRNWRDRRLMALAAHKAGQAKQEDS